MKTLSDQWSCLNGTLYAETCVGEEHITPLILLHGFTQTCRSWDPFIKELKSSRSLIRVDAPGHGESELIETDLPASARLIGEVGGLGIYMGYSMGGRMALHVALNYPNLVERLILVSTTAGLRTYQERQQRIESDDRLADSISEIGIPAFIDNWLAQPIFSDLRQNADDRLDRQRNTPRGLSSSLRLAGTGTQESLWHRLAELTMPVLVIAGEKDEKFTDIARDMVLAIGNNAQFALIKDAGHAVQAERVKQVAEAVRKFLL